MDELKSFDAAFISGTSPKVLPIAFIDEIPFDVNDPLLRYVMEQYNNL
jgi:branched-chain amino acid aminotransferase